MRDIATFPAGLFTGEAGGAVGFDPATGHVINFNKGDFDGGYNLAMAFLGEQILWEALDLVEVPEFRADAAGLLPLRAGAVGGEDRPLRPRLQPAGASGRSTRG